MGHRFYQRSSRCAYLLNLTQMTGSVFPSAFVIAFPCGLASGALVILFDHYYDDGPVHQAILTNNVIWSSFSFIIGFLVVFRTSHAFNRFWEALTSTHKMGAEWFDACSALLSFSKASDAEPHLVYAFHNKAIRLFSMMHAVAIAELEDLDRGEDGTEQDTAASFQMLELLDASAWDDQTLLAVQESDARVELIYQWVQHLIVENTKTGVLSVPPPILTRAFQVMSAGLVCFNDAMKIADTPFPFPYAQTCDMMLFVQYLCTPLVVATYVNHWLWAFLFSFFYIFSFWALTLTGQELEYPFGTDANDIDTKELQLSMNHKLQLLVTKDAWFGPKLRHPGKEHQKLLVRRLCSKHNGERASFTELWNSANLAAMAAHSTNRRFSISPDEERTQNPYCSYDSGEAKNSSGAGEHPPPQQESSSPRRSDFITAVTSMGGLLGLVPSGPKQATSGSDVTPSQSMGTARRSPSNSSRTYSHRGGSVSRMRKTFSADNTYVNDLGDGALHVKSATGSEEVSCRRSMSNHSPLPPSGYVSKESFDETVPHEGGALSGITPMAHLSNTRRHRENDGSLQSV